MRSLRIWTGLGVCTTMAALAPATHAASEAARPAAVAPTFQGDLDHALAKIFAGEGGEEGAGLTPMWPTVSAPALTGPEIEKVVKGNTLTMKWHYDYYFAPDGTLLGTQTSFEKLGDASKCPKGFVEGEGYSMSSDGKTCWKIPVVPAAGTWQIRNHQLCFDLTWQGGAKRSCQYLTILLDNIALFDANGKIEGKGMKLVKGKFLTKLAHHSQ